MTSAIEARVTLSIPFGQLANVHTFLKAQQIHTRHQCTINDCLVVIAKHDEAWPSAWIDYLKSGSVKVEPAPTTPKTDSDQWACGLYP